MTSTTIRRTVAPYLTTTHNDELPELFNRLYSNYMNNKAEIARCEGDWANKASPTCRISLLTKNQLEHDNITNEVDLKYMARRIIAYGGEITQEQKNNINLRTYSGGKKNTHRHSSKSKRQNNRKRGRKSRSRVA